MKSSSRGFGAVAIIAIISLIVVSGLLGWKIWSLNTNTKQLQPANNTFKPSIVKQSEITNNTDLDSAEKALDSENIEGQQIDQLNTETNF